MIRQKIITSDNRKAWIYKGKSKGTCPVTYKKIDVIGHNIGNNYNSSTLTLYKNRKGILKYEIYRDGNFYPYYGTFEYVD